MSDEYAITVKDLYKSFRLPHEKRNSVKTLFMGIGRKHKKVTEERYALRDISFEIKKGSFYGIVGRNGSGKSTLLKLLAEIYQPSRGEVNVEGRLVPFIELGVGFNPELTGRENVYLSGALSGFSTKEMDEMYDDIVDFAELKPFMDQKLKNYSSGMQVRLAFAVATRAKADILLIDEVLAVGDADFQRKCFQYFRSLKKSKITVVFVSHDMEAVREYCDECILIDNSKVIYKGLPDVAAEKYTQMFNDSVAKETTTSNEKVERWGDGAAQFSNVRVKVTKDYVAVDATVDFKETMENPILGVLVKNTAGETVCGTNNKVNRLKTGTYAADSSVSVAWELPNIFSSDDYTVEVAVTHADGVTQADWWHNAGKFSIKNTYTTPHIVSPRITMQVEK